MLDDVVGAYGSRFLLAAGGVGLALLLLIIVLWVIRSRAPSPFVRGGRNRQPRLQVLDAAAVDARRRLVLVRRDDVEHLIMHGPGAQTSEGLRFPASCRPSSALRDGPDRSAGPSRDTVPLHYPAPRIRCSMLPSGLPLPILPSLSSAVATVLRQEGGYHVKFRHTPAGNLAIWLTSVKHP